MFKEVCVCWLRRCACCSRRKEAYVLFVSSFVIASGISFVILRRRREVVVEGSLIKDLKGRGMRSAFSRAS